LNQVGLLKPALLFLSMVASLILLIAAMGEISCASRIKPIVFSRGVAPNSPMIRFLGRSQLPQLQMEMGANEVSQEGPGKFGRTNKIDIQQKLPPTTRSQVLAGGGRPGHLAPLRENRHTEIAMRKSPGMNMADQEGESLTPQEESSCDEGSGDECVINLGKFEPVVFGAHLRAIAAAGKKMDVALMFTIDFRLKLQDAKMAVGRLNDIPIDTGLISSALRWNTQGGSDTRHHPEAKTQGISMLQRIRSRGMLKGTVLNPGTSVSSIEDLLKNNGLELVVIMLENTGLGDRRYIDIALNQIKEVKRICRENDVAEPYIISLDKDINDENAPKSSEEGMDVIDELVDAVAKNDEMAASRAIQALLPGHGSVESIDEQTTGEEVQ